MRFSDSLLDEIRARLPVSEVVRQRVVLKKQGREWRGLSPFNKEKTPSFYVNDQKGFYHDFSSGKSGDQFKFLMETEGLTFPEAVERLAQMAGVPLPKQTREAEQAEQKRKTLHEVMELATRFFQAQLAGDAGRVAREYAERRGLKRETLAEFQIGFAPSHRFALKEYLGSQGIPIEDMIEAGLLIAGDDIPVPYDRFRDRLMIPIHDVRGRVIAFGGRALASDAQAKYLNSPETTLFHKGATVFNFHRARHTAHDEGSVVVVEGYMDAIAVYQAGLKSVVASMGTAFTDDQIALLWRLSPEPVVCFDSDRAGVNAAHRSIDRILPELKVGRTFRFAFMQGGKDPDDLIQEKGIDAFKAVLSGSLPIWDVLWERETAVADASSPDHRARLEHRLNQLIGTIKDPLVNSAYRGTCRINLSDFFWRAVRAKRETKRNTFPKLSGGIEVERHRQEAEKTLLGMLVHYPEFLEEKESAVGRLEFSPEFRAFHSSLYDLLVISKDVSVELIYKHLSPVFYEVLEEVHGHPKGNGRSKGSLPRGHRFFARFPIAKIDPPSDFVSRCIDYFVQKLTVRQMEIEIEELVLSDAPLHTDAVGERITQLVRELQLQKELLLTTDMALAEEALALKRIWSPTEWKAAA
jgi:DNA primase